MSKLSEPSTAIKVNDGERLPGLDGLRALGMMTVLLSHQGIIPFGWEAMQMFFVLSGFLITRLLWQAKNQPLGTYLINFYGRRSLRIFPLYYGVLLAVAVLALLTSKGAVLRPALPYLATYTYNWWYALNPYQHSQFISHFWSLCAEEQLYLFWPLFIFLCRERYLRAALLGIVLLGPVIRLVEILLLRSLPGLEGTMDLTVYVLTPTYFDSFALGAYVALFPLGGKRKAFYATLATLVIVTFVVLSQSQGIRDAGGMGPGYILLWGYSLVNICSALAIDCLVCNKLAPRFFNAPVMRYMGKISYGVYVFHWPVQNGLKLLLPQSGLSIQLGLQLVITFSLAAASYAFWEKPFLAKRDVWFRSSKKVRLEAAMQ